MWHSEGVPQMFKSDLGSTFEMENYLQILVTVFFFF